MEIENLQAKYQQLQTETLTLHNKLEQANQTVLEVKSHNSILQEEYKTAQQNFKKKQANMQHTIYDLTEKLEDTSGIPVTARVNLVKEQMESKSKSDSKSLMEARIHITEL